MGYSEKRGVSADTEEPVEGLLDTLRAMDSPDEVPCGLISAQGIGRLLDVSSPQVKNWLGQAGEQQTQLPNGPGTYYDWQAIRYLSPPLRIASTSPVPRVMLDQLPGGRAANGNGTPESYARLLQLLLLSPPDRARVPHDWENPVSSEVAAWLGGAACERLGRVLRGRSSLVFAGPAVDLVGPQPVLLLGQSGPEHDSERTEAVRPDPIAAASAAELAALDAAAARIADGPQAEPPAAEAPAEEADGTAQPGTADAITQPPNAVVSALSGGLLREGSMADLALILSVEESDAPTAESRRRRVPVTKIFERSLAPGDLYRLGTDTETVDQAVRRLQDAQDGSLAELDDGVPVYRGTGLHKILIELFGLQAADAEEYLGVRPGLIEDYVGGSPGHRRGRISSGAAWDEVLVKFRPDLIEFSPMLHPDRPGAYGFEDMGQLLAFVRRYGGEYDERDEDTYLSHTAQELLHYQLIRSSLPDAADEEHAAWRNVDEMAEASYRTRDEVVAWTQTLPLTVGPLPADRRTWLRSREAPYLALPHYSHAVGALFGRIAAIRMDEELMEQRRRVLYYPMRMRPAMGERFVPDGN